MTPTDRATRQPLVVSIVGPSGAGKSQLASLTQTVLGDDIASRVPTDYFFVPGPVHMPRADFLRKPLRYDWGLLGSVLQQPVGIPAETPDADFTGFTRLSDAGGRPFTIRPVMITEAMAACPDADLVVVLDVPDGVRRERIAARDIHWSTSVLANWEHLETTWQAGQAELPSPNLTLDGTQPLPANAHAVADLIRAHLASGGAKHHDA